MNPFDLPGPPFLLFYIILAAIVIAGGFFLRRKFEGGPAPRIDLSDPLLIAFLRGGHPEVLRVATISLIDRGLLTCVGTRLTTSPNARPESVRRPIERDLLQKFASGGEATNIFTDVNLKAKSYEYEAVLKNHRLLPDGYIVQGRMVIFLCALAVVGGVGLVKLMIALERGRTNVLFLIIFMIVAVVFLVKLSFPRLTSKGEAILEDLKRLYRGLKGRASLLQPGGATIEPLVLAAVFGVSALSGPGFAYASTIFPVRERSSLTSSDTTSYVSSCGSSSCGSSCGGGGSCGGGCGGCGS